MNLFILSLSRPVSFVHAISISEDRKEHAYGNAIRHLRFGNLYGTQTSTDRLLPLAVDYCRMWNTNMAHQWRSAVDTAKAM
jgi:hypothetical protein